MLENRAVLVAGRWKQLVFVGGDGLGGHGLNERALVQLGRRIENRSRRT